MRIFYGQDQLQILQTQGATMEPVYDPTGMDYLYSKVVLDVSFVWHPFATSTNTLGAAAPPFDPLALSIRHLKERLNYPRQTLQVSVGGKLVWVSPDFDAVLNKRRPCDPGGGPFPEVLSLTEIQGDYGAMGRWRVTFHKRLSNLATLLSNRWTPRSITNEAGMTTRIVTGYAIMRTDMVGYFALVPPGGVIAYQTIDDFRNWLFLPVPAGFVRAAVDVTVTEKGDKARYIVTDIEDPNPMGDDGAGVGAVTFDGGCTTASSCKIKSWNDAAGLAGHVQWWNPATWASTAMQSVVADNMAVAWAQVWGGKQVPKVRLLDRALQICLDRMNTGGAAGLGGWFSHIVGVTVTQGMGKSERQGRWVRAEVVWRPAFSTILDGAKMNLGNVRSQVNYSNDVTPVGLDNAGNIVKPVLANPTFPGDVPQPVAGQKTATKYYNKNLPRGRRNETDVNGVPLDDGGSRGSWMGALLVQALQTPFDPANLNANPAPAAGPPPEKPAGNQATVA